MIVQARWLVQTVVGVDNKDVIIVHLKWWRSKEVVSVRRVTRRERVLRPGSIDADNTTVEQTVWIRISVGYIPPYLLHSCKHRRCQAEPGEE